MYDAGGGGRHAGLGGGCRHAGSDEGGHSAAFKEACSSAMCARALAAAEIALGLVCFPESSPALYGLSVGRLHLGMLMCLAISALFTFPQCQFSLRLTPMQAATGGQDS